MRIVSCFHTIKSILNVTGYFGLCVIDGGFHTIKSILNLEICIVASVTSVVFILLSLF